MTKNAPATKRQPAKKAAPRAPRPPAANREYEPAPIAPRNPEPEQRELLIPAPPIKPATLGEMLEAQEELKRRGIDAKKTNETLLSVWVLLRRDNPGITLEETADVPLHLLVNLGNGAGLQPIS